MYKLVVDFELVIKAIRHYKSIDNGKDSELIKRICDYLEYCLKDIPNDCWSEYKIGNNSLEEVIEDISYAISIGIEFICRSGKIYYKRKV